MFHNNRGSIKAGSRARSSKTRRATVARRLIPTSEPRARTTNVSRRADLCAHSAHAHHALHGIYVSWRHHLPYSPPPHTRPTHRTTLHRPHVTRRSYLLRTHKSRVRYGRNLILSSLEVEHDPRAYDTPYTTCDSTSMQDMRYHADKRATTR